MSSLKTNYKDDVFTGKRKYTEVNNGDGTISFNDVTSYSQVGDTYGAAQINEHNNILNQLDNSAFRNTDGASTDLVDGDYIPFYDTSAGARKRTLFSNLKAKLDGIFAPKQHPSNSAATFGAATASQFGHVMLSDSYTTSAGAASASKGASSKAVYDAYTALNNAKARENHADTSTKFGKADGTHYGHVIISDSTGSNASAADGFAATPRAVNTERLRAIAQLRTSGDTAGGKNFYFGQSGSGSDIQYGWYENTSRNGTFHPFAEKVQTGNASTAGILKLSDSTTSTSSTGSGVAATPKAVKTVYDKAETISNEFVKLLTSTQYGHQFIFNFTVQDGKYGWKDGDAGTFHPFDESAGEPRTRFYAKDGVICAASTNRENGIWCKIRTLDPEWDEEGVSANHVILNCRYRSGYQYKVSTTDRPGTLYDFKDHDSSVTTKQHMNINQSVTLENDYPGGFYFIADEDA